MKGYSLICHNIIKKTKNRKKVLFVGNLSTVFSTNLLYLCHIEILPMKSMNY